MPRMRGKPCRHACKFGRGKRVSTGAFATRSSRITAVNTAAQTSNSSSSVSHWATKGQLKYTAPKMFAPRFQSFIRPASNRASQCLRRRRATISKSSILGQMRQQRYQSTRSTTAAAKALFKSYPFSVTAAFALYVPPQNLYSPVLTSYQNPRRRQYAHVFELYIS